MFAYTFLLTDRIILLPMMSQLIGELSYSRIYRKTKIINIFLDFVTGKLLRLKYGRKNWGKAVFTLD